jgi:opacity protein-like surface antigen
VYGTAGWAVAGVHNSFNDMEFGIFVDQTKTMSGFVWGGGVERMFGQHWRGRIEALAVDLGDTTVHTLLPGTPLRLHDAFRQQSGHRPRRRVV